MYSPKKNSIVKWRFDRINGEILHLRFSSFFFHLGRSLPKFERLGSLPTHSFSPFLFTCPLFIPKSLLSSNILLLLCVQQVVSWGHTSYHAYAGLSPLHPHLFHTIELSHLRIPHIETFAIAYLTLSTLNWWWKKLIAFFKM